MPLSSEQMVVPFCALNRAHIWSASWYVSILLMGFSLPALLTHPVAMTAPDTAPQVSV